MEALPNADSVENLSSGFTPIAFPKAVSSQTGVSVEYIPDPLGLKRWYVFRASYGRAQRAVDYLIRQGIYVYMPKCEKDIQVGHRVKTVLVDLLPNFVFAYLDNPSARHLTMGPAADEAVTNAAEAFQVSEILSFYYNHSVIDAFGKNPPLTIPDRQMQSFIIATNTHDENVIRLDGRSYTFKGDDEVDVIAGKFKGVRGKVIRAGRQQRILIELSGFMTFATAYVPTDFIRKI